MIFKETAINGELYVRLRYFVDFCPAQKSRNNEISSASHIFFVKIACEILSEID